MCVCEVMCVCVHCLCAGLHRSVAREDMLKFIISLNEQGTKVTRQLSEEVGSGASIPDLCV